MKKILLLIIGLGLIIWGILGLNELKRQRNAIPERPGYGISEKDRVKDDTRATVLIVVGGVLFLWGLASSFKPKQAAKTEAFVTVTPTTPTISSILNNASTDSIAQLERFAKLKEQGVLTEEEFQKEKAKILG